MASSVEYVPRDLSSLKLQKRMIQEKLKKTNTKLNRVNNVLSKKNEVNYINPMDTMTSHGVAIKDLRQPVRSIKVDTLSLKYKKPTTHEDFDPIPIKPGSNLDRIRMEHALRTHGKKMLQARKEAEVKRIAAEEQKKRRGKRSIFPKVTVPASMLPNRYTRGELPCSIEHGVKGWYLSWVCPLENLDYEYYLPIFFDGLQCDTDPHRFIACQGVEDLLYAARGNAARVIPCVYNCVRPLRNALSKFKVDIMLRALKAIQQLVCVAPGVGEELLPYSKLFLAPIGAFMDQNRNIGDSIDYAQQKNTDVGEQVRNTLELLEEKGGPGAFKAIKFSIPLYESCMKDV